MHLEVPQHQEDGSSDRKGAQADLPLEFRRGCLLIGLVSVS